MTQILILLIEFISRLKSTTVSLALVSRGGTIGIGFSCSMSEEYFRGNILNTVKNYICSMVASGWMI